MRRLVVAALFLLSLVPVSAWSLDIPGDPSSCGMWLYRGDPGVLQGDLDCTGRNACEGIVLTAGAELELNGHRISGALGHDVSCYTAVSPSRTCMIKGPGEISGALNGIAAASRVRVRDVTIHGNDVGIWKIYGDINHSALVDLDNVILRDNTNEDIKGGGAIHAKDTRVTARTDRPR